MQNFSHNRRNSSWKEQDQVVSRPFSLFGFIVVVLGFGLSTVAPAQTQTTPQTQDCTTSLLAPCRDTPYNPQANLPSDTNENDSINLRSNESSQDPNNNSTYVDSAGRDPRQTPTRQSQNSQTFPPDAITDLQRLASSSTGEMLPVFGRDFFKQVPTTFAPGDQLGVTPDYVIGPGDDVLLRFWGPESFNSQLTVDRSGSIYVPKVGSIHVAGLRFDELQKQISTELSRTYRNLNISVNLGRLRSIQVYVVGEARRPGAYTISALSTVLNALFASGGPNVQGSLRHIQVRRGGTTISEFDLYDLVLRGDKSKDVRLEQGDTIFIPPVGAQVALAGSVKHPAIYELGTESTLGDILKIAGGFSATASSTQISLERIEADRTRHATTVALDSAGNGMMLRDGDVIFAGHITAGYKQSVTIRGNLANPGRFAWHEGMRLSDILPDRSSLLTNDYWRERNRLGVPVPLFEPLEKPKTTYGKSNGRDGETLDNEPPPFDEQTGIQRDQNPSSQKNAGNQINSVNQVELATAGVLNQAAQQEQRAEAQTPQYGTDTQPKTDVNGRTKTPPQNKIRIPAPEIDWSYAVIERLDANTLKSSLVPFNLGKLVQDHDPSQNLQLLPGDVVTILSQNDISVPQELRTKYVRLEGEFPGAGVYSALPGETLDHLVERAGGLTGKAYLYGSSFTRESARVFQQQRLDEYISTLSTDLERAGAVRAASSTTGIIDPNALAEQRSLVAQLRQLRATGRVVLEFTPTSSGAGTIPNLPLENEDVFRVPSRPGDGQCDRRGVWTERVSVYPGPKSAGLHRVGG